MLPLPYVLVPMQTAAFFDQATGTLTYIVFDDDTGDAVIIDPVLDAEGESAAPVAFAREHKLTARWILETHLHDDHVSGVHALADVFRAPTAVGEGVVGQYGGGLRGGRSRWSRLLRDHEVLRAGDLEICALHTPGHTASCTSYVIGDAVFTGDALLMPDVGTGRCDLLGGDPGTLYESITRKLYALPLATRVMVGHDERGGSAPQYTTTIAASRARNVLVRDGVSAREFIDRRRQLDATLPRPALMQASLHHNLL